MARITQPGDEGVRPRLEPLSRSPGRSSGDDEYFWEPVHGLLVGAPCGADGAAGTIEPRDPTRRPRPTRRRSRPSPGASPTSGMTFVTLGDRFFGAGTVADRRRGAGRLGGRGRPPSSRRCYRDHWRQGPRHPQRRALVGPDRPALRRIRRATTGNRHLALHGPRTEVHPSTAPRSACMRDFYRRRADLNPRSSRPHPPPGAPPGARRVRAVGRACPGPAGRRARRGCPASPRRLRAPRR